MDRPDPILNPIQWEAITGETHYTRILIEAAREDAIDEEIYKQEKKRNGTERTSKGSSESTKPNKTSKG